MSNLVKSTSQDSLQHQRDTSHTVRNLRGSVTSLAAAITSSLDNEVTDTFQLYFADVVEDSEEVEVRYAQLKAIPSCLNQAKHLVVLNLSHNQINSIPGGLCSVLTSLKVLDLSSNRIQNLPDELEYFSSLSHLSLGNNLLTTAAIEATSWKAMNSLQKLNLNRNQLDAFPPSILCLKSLTHLGLSDNQISEIPVGISSLTQLAYLGLRNNRLRDLPKSLSLLNLKAIALEGNEFDDEKDQFLSFKGRVSVLNISGLSNTPGNEIERKRTVKALGVTTKKAIQSSPAIETPMTVMIITPPILDLPMSADSTVATEVQSATTLHSKIPSVTE